MNTPRVAKSRILIVEDEEKYQRRWAKHCQRALEEIGFEPYISIAANAEEAKRLLLEETADEAHGDAKKRLPFDLITMDINLSGPETKGGTQGMDLLKLIADQADKLPGTCVIVISGSDNPVQMGEVWGFSEVVDYMRKDVTRNEIVRIAAKIVALHANTLRRLRDPRHPYKEWKSLLQWTGQIDTLERELVEQGWRKLRFTRPVWVEQMIYLDQDTGLPGPKAVEDRLKLLLREKKRQENWTLMIMQIDQLDRFAEVVGGEKGKASALRLAADVAGDVLEKEGEDRSFIGRREDEIVVVTDLPNIAQISSDIRGQFSTERKTLYSRWHHRITEGKSEGQLKEVVVVESPSGEEQEVKLPWIEVKIGIITKQEIEELYDVPAIERAIAKLVSQLE